MLRVMPRTLLRLCFAKLLALLVGEPDRYAAGAFSRFDNKPFSAYHASLRRRGHVIRSMRTLLKYTAQAARRREPTVGQEAVSTRSRKRHPVRNQWFTPRQGRLKTACCLSEKGVATAKQRFDRAVGTAGAPLRKIGIEISLSGVSYESIIMADDSMRV